MPSETIAVPNKSHQTDMSLSYIDTFFPLGFPVQIESNYAEILDIARQDWGILPQRYSREPLRILLEVVEGDNQPNLERPQYHFEQGVLNIVFDKSNRILVDLERGVARGQLYSSMLENKESVQYHVLEAAALSMISTMRAIALHAACIEWNGNGILLCGESGAGKTSLAYACALAGWGYLSDDATYLVLNDPSRTAIGNSRKLRFREAAQRLFPELKGRPITRRVTGKPSIEVETSELSGIRCADSINIRYIFFLNRNASSAPALYPFDKLRALDYFTKFLLSPSAISPAKAALEKLVDAEIYELRYVEFRWAIDRMRELVEDGV